MVRTKRKKVSSKNKNVYNKESGEIEREINPAYYIKYLVPVSVL